MNVLQITLSATICNGYLQRYKVFIMNEIR
jgi:hypothetical protein